MNLRLDPSTEHFLKSLAETTRRMEVAQQQISSGKRLVTVSDDPDQISSLLQVRLELETTQQVQQNLARYKTEVDTAEAGLATVQTIVDRARVLGAQAANSATSQVALNGIANELQALIERVVAVANTNVEGRYVFSGDQDSQAAFALDFTQTPPYGAYLGTPSTREALASDGSRFKVAKTASELFSQPGSSVLGALEGLRTAVLGGDLPTIESAMDTLIGANDYLSTQHAWYGGVQSRVNDAVSGAAKRALRFQSQIGSIEDADAVSAISAFQRATNEREAALMAHARLPNKSLFDYLG
jgi:flagellar hook-associated protein 3 FlgL